jgi:cytochrome P450
LRRPSARAVAAARISCDRLADYARSAYDAPDTPSASFVRRLRDLGLSFEEAKGVVSLIFLAGTLTTASALPRIVALLVDGGHIDAIRARPQALAGAISEGLRYTAPVPATVRIAARDVELRGHRIASGTRLVILTCNLARDPSLFPAPDRFDPMRTHDPRARNLWFGAGPHFCLGFAVAQLQLLRVLETLLAQPGTLRIVRRRAARGVMVAAYARLDVRLERGAS